MQKMKVQKLIVLAVVSACLVVGSSWAVAEVTQVPFEETKTIRFGNWGAIKHDPATDITIKKFQEKYPWVKVQIIEVADVLAYPKFVTMFVNKADSIDVFDYGQMAVNQFSRLGGLEPLDDLFTEEVKQNCSPGFLEVSYLDGHYWIAPHFSKFGIQMYRTDMLAEAGFTHPPRTWDELVEQGKKLTKGDVWGYSYESIKQLAFRNLMNWLFMAGGTVIDEKGKVVVNSKDVVKALSFITDLRNKYKIVTPDVIMLGDQDVASEFRHGRTANILTDNEKIFMAREDPGIKDVFDWSLVATAEEGISPWSNAVHGALYLNRYTPRKAAARELIKYFMSLEAQKRELLVENNAPPMLNTFDDPEVIAAEPRAETYKEGLMFARGISLPAHGTVREIGGEWIQRALLGELTPQEALNEMQKELNDLLGQE